MNVSTPRHEAEVPLGEAALAAIDAAPAQPWWHPLRSTFAFLSIPALCLIVPWLLGERLSVQSLYVVAGLCGAALAYRALLDPEWVLAAFILYLPFSRVYAASVAPGINGTNVLYALVLLAWVAHAVRNERPFLSPLPFTRLVMVWGLLSVVSVITAMVTQGSGFITGGRLPTVKAWFDQFFVFFAVLNLIRDGAAARRMAVYMMLGMLLVLASGYLEWEDKRGYDRIDKARLLGPQGQPNDFGAFIVYGMGIPGALMLCYIWRVRTWLLGVPVLYVAARVTLATFSRGAIIGVGALTAGIFLIRGRFLAAAIAATGVLVVEYFPEVLPVSMSARMNQTAAEDGELDKSSQTRLILWDAGINASLDNPIFGTGFRTFPYVKDQYASAPTAESDNHNMFLFVSSQMGLPALLVFVLIFARLAYVGAQLHKGAADGFAKAIGLGAAGMAAGVVGINVFGSRMTDIEVMAYVWITIAVVSHLWNETQNQVLRSSAARELAGRHAETLMGTGKPAH